VQGARVKGRREGARERGRVRVNGREGKEPSGLHAATGGKGDAVALARVPSPPPGSTGNCQKDYLVKTQHLPLRSTSVSATPYLPTCGPPGRLTRLSYFPIHSP
jgi:hypothetical protein